MLRTVTAKQLKNRTGEVLREVGRGVKVVITRRGKPHALLSPVEEGQLAELGVRPFEAAWASIEKALRETSPQFPTWKEAIRRSRRRA